MRSTYLMGAALAILLIAATLAMAQQAAAPDKPAVKDAGRDDSNTIVVTGQRVDAVYLKTHDGAYDDARAGGSPKVNAKLGADWDLALAPRLSVSARGIYASSQVLDESGVQSIPSWFRLDLGAGYKTTVADRADRNVTFRANVENALNKGYWSSTPRHSLLRDGSRAILLSATVGT